MERRDFLKTAAAAGATAFFGFAIPTEDVGKIKRDWEIGDKFKIHPELSLDNDSDDKITGIHPNMLELKGETLMVAVIITALGPTLMIDDRENYAWRPEWIVPV